MRIFEVNDFLNRFNAFLLESFKQDMYHQYPEAKDNEKFNNAIKVFNNNQKIKEVVKKKISLNGNIAKSIKNAYPTAGEFVELINTVINELTTKEEEREEYNQIKQGTASIGETDYWLIPCHTFEEAHEAAFKYAGNLPRLTKEEITNKYGIETPRPASFYNTNKTPEEFLEYMKNEDKFFMAPSWCISADDYYFNERYNLTTKPHENPKCYIFISKKYPNVRFCVTLKKEKEKVADIKGGEIEVSIKETKLDEVRDTWQIGGADIKDVGLDMMKLAFGQQKIDEVMKDIRHTIKSETVSISKLENGELLLFKANNIPSISGSFDNLTKGSRMFTNSSLEKVNCNFPVLEEGVCMFYQCESLSEFTGNLPNLLKAQIMFAHNAKLEKFECKNLSKLENGEQMFNDCENLKSFNSKLPNLIHGASMFGSCGLMNFEVDMPKLVSSGGMFEENKNLKNFNCKLSSLKDGRYMFLECKNLTSFRSDLSSLEQGSYMFEGCENLKRFEGNLSSLKEAYDMFKGCKLDTESVKNIAETISTITRSSSITIGVDEMDEEKEKYIEMIKEKGWIVRIQ